MVYGAENTQFSKTNLRKIVIIFLFISLNMCFGCSKELSHRDVSFEYPQHMFWLRNKKNNFRLRTLIWGPAENTHFIYIYFANLLWIYLYSKQSLKYVFWGLVFHRKKSSFLFCFLDNLTVI